MQDPMVASAARCNPRPHKRSRGSLALLQQLSPLGPTSVEDITGYAREAARVVCMCPYRQARLRSVLRRVIFTDSVFTGMACWEDALRMFLNAAADHLRCSRPCIIHNSGCDIDQVALHVLKHRLPEVCHQKLFVNLLDRLPPNAMKRIVRLLPTAKMDSQETSDRYKQIYTLMLKKPDLFFPANAMSKDVLTGKQLPCRWRPTEQQQKEKFLVLNQGSTPCTAFSRRSSQAFVSRNLSCNKGDIQGTRTFL